MSEVERNGSVATVRAPGDIVASMARGFRRELLSLVDDGTKELVIDMAEVAMVDSVGLGVLISTHNALSKAGGKLTVFNISDEMHDLFKVMRLDQHLEVKHG